MLKNAQNIKNKRIIGGFLCVICLLNIFTLTFAPTKHSMAQSNNNLETPTPIKTTISYTPETPTPTKTPIPYTPPATETDTPAPTLTDTPVPTTYPPTPSVTLTPTPTIATPPNLWSDTGGMIDLSVQFDTKWSWQLVQWQEIQIVVQWRDNIGNWHDVEGWRGSLDSVHVNADGTVTGNKSWWVPADYAGLGPFRWEISYTHQGQKEVVHSSPFFLLCYNEEKANNAIKLE